MAKRTETIEEFLARGGEIEQCDPQPTPEEKPIVKTSNTQHPHLASITDGQFYFAEKQTRKVDHKKKFLNNLDKTNLPKEVVDKLKNAVRPHEQD